MKQGNDDPVVPLWKLERFLIGELPPEEMARIEKLRTEDPKVAEWLRALQAEHADLQASHPTGIMAGRIWNKLKAEPGGVRGARGADGGARLPGLLRRMQSAIAAGTGKAALVPIFGLALLLTLMPNRFSCSTGDDVEAALGRRGTTGIEDTRLKGSAPALFLYRKTGAGAEPLASGSLARSGDLIQVQYDGAGRKYGAIFSLDGQNHVTWHLPGNGLQAALLASGKTPLSSAFELDEAPGREDFHFLASDQPFSPDSLAAAIAAGIGSVAISPGQRPDSLSPASPSRISHTLFALTKDNLK
jgi:hypothetical protein